MKREDAESLFHLAGFQIKRVWELPNGYWPLAYDETRKASPWWLVMTEFGPIEIGWRKRVILIKWDATSLRDPVITTDDVTKDPTYIHAWSVLKALEYLKALRAAFSQPLGEVIREELNRG